MALLNSVSTTGVDIISSSDWIILDSTCVPTAEVGVQTMTTAINRFPVPSRTHPVPWGLNTDKSSPLNITKSIVNKNNRCKKRKLEDILTRQDYNWPPRKKAALEDEYVSVKDEDIKEIPSQLNAFVQVSPVENGVRSIGTNTLHIPFRRNPSQFVRHKVWERAAKQFLCDEDHDDKRSHITRKDTIKRIADDILGYYCRRRETRVDRVKRMVDDILTYHCK